MMCCVLYTACCCWGMINHILVRKQNAAPGLRPFLAGSGAALGAVEMAVGFSHVSQCLRQRGAMLGSWRGTHPWVCFPSSITEHTSAVLFGLEQL